MTDETEKEEAAIEREIAQMREIVKSANTSSGISAAIVKLQAMEIRPGLPLEVFNKYQSHLYALRDFVIQREQSEKAEDDARSLMDAINLIAEYTMANLAPGYELVLEFTSEECGISLYDDETRNLSEDFDTEQSTIPYMCEISRRASTDPE